MSILCEIEANKAEPTRPVVPNVAADWLTFNVPT